MNNIHTDLDGNEGAASIDPTFSASFKNSFKMDYFGIAEGIHIFSFPTLLNTNLDESNPRSSFTTKPTDSSTKKVIQDRI